MCSIYLVILFRVMHMHIVTILFITILEEQFASAIYTNEDRFHVDMTRWHYIDMANITRLKFKFVI